VLLLSLLLHLEAVVPGVLNQPMTVSAAVIPTEILVLASAATLVLEVAASAAVASTAARKGRKHSILLLDFC